VRPAKPPLLHSSLLAAALAIALLTGESAAGAVTFTQARARLRAWHLSPAPLWPRKLPAPHRGVNVHLYRFAGIDYGADFGSPDDRDCHTIDPSNWCVGLRRAGADALAQMLNDPVDFPHPQRLRVRRRNVYFAFEENNAGGWWMAWSEDGHTYLAWDWRDQRAAAKRTLTAFVQSLRRLSGSEALPAVPRVPIYNRVSLRFGGSYLLVKPRVITYTGDDSGFFAGKGKPGYHPNSPLHWRTWSRTRALATGADWLSNCVPSCGGGFRTPFPVRLNLYRPRRDGGYAVFTRMRMTYTNNRPAHATRRSYVFRLGYGSGVFMWVGGTLGP
jgi:hypothetical protein